MVNDNQNEEQLVIQIDSSETPRKPNKISFCGGGPATAPQNAENSSQEMSGQ